MRIISGSDPDTALRARIERLLAGTQPASSPDEAGFPGVAASQVEELRTLMPTPLRPAAVLMPIVDRPEGLTLLFTQRATALKRHAGQVSFPGGRLERDEGPLAAALRETEEEIGLAREFISVAGYLRSQLIATGYWVTPVVGFVRPGFNLRLDPVEVHDVFEAPLTHVLDPAHHGQRERQLGAVTVRTTEIHFEDRLIWGATAAMLVALAGLLRSS